MNIVSDHNTAAYTGYGYPVVTEISDCAPPYHGNQKQSYDNQHNSKGFRFRQYVFDIGANTGLYNEKKTVELTKMQLIGTMVDLYA